MEKFFLSEFPELSRETLRFIKKGFDTSYRAFSREYGDTIEAVFDPVLYFLVWFEKLLQNSPWPLVLICFLAIIYFGSRKISVTVGSLLAFLLIGVFGMWEDTMSTVSIIGVCTLLSIGIGIPVGVLMAKSERAQKICTP